MAEIFRYVPHPRIAERQLVKPSKVVDQRRLDHPNPMVRFNARFGLIITVAVGTMWCAYLFACVALISLPSNIHSTQLFILWLSSSFLQLVLLPIIIVGQNIQAKASDKRAEDTYHDAEAVLQEATQIQAHLAAQDQALSSILDRIAQIGHA